MAFSDKGKYRRNPTKTIGADSSLINHTVGSNRVAKTNENRSGKTHGSVNRTFLGRIRGLTSQALGDGKAESPRRNKHTRALREGKKGYNLSDMAFSDHHILSTSNEYY